MKSSEIRQKFLDYFASKGHTIVASSSLVPHEDPTLLFTNAGMNQFKDVFLGFDKRPYTRATSSQKCVRAGGKHNDLENVGYTARHHTFFEMLGNFSFGDYFKRDAINYAWELLTVVFKLPKDKLTITVYAEDDEAYDIWTKEIGVSAGRVIRIGDNKGARYASDNFWMMGDTGPCGPCTEIFYDHGEHIPGGPPGSPGEDGDRYIEIWNNVFMQFNRDEAGVMHPLPKPSVDTGMGLERISAVLQHVHSNYEIDLFQALIGAAARETHREDLLNQQAGIDARSQGAPDETYHEGRRGGSDAGDKADATPAGLSSLKVLADHIRACSFLIADGVIPGNEGRGFVLRRIIRRAIRHGYKLGTRAAFFHKMVPDLVAEMGVAFPELTQAQVQVKGILKLEEERFFATIEHGMAILEADLAGMAKQGNRVFNGETAFKLHDTFGFPLDLTQDVCREHGVTVDAAAFDKAMAQQKDLARAAGKFKMAANLEYSGPATVFHGYQMLESKAKVLALYKDGILVNELNEGDTGVAVLDDTPFYAESGGQVGDRGELRSAHGIFAVEDTQKIQASVFGHHGVVKTGKLTVGNSVTARVDVAARHAIMRNHSATHIMNKALREVLGAHVQQKGSLVDPDKLRFDFAHTMPLTHEDMFKIEQIVNGEIIANSPTQVRQMEIDDARKTGAMMLFGEKYGDEVRVLNIGSSCELCGGTHVERTGDIGLFQILEESGVAAGVRRIEARTGFGAIQWIQEGQQELFNVAEMLSSSTSEIPNRVQNLINQRKQLELELAQLKSKFASAQGDELVAKAQDINGVKVLAAVLEGADAVVLRETLDKLKDKLKSVAIVLAAVVDGKVSLIAGVTPDLVAKIKAGELVNMVAQQVGGKGGGRPDMAMAGGTQPEHLAAALASVPAWVKGKLVPELLD
ncbi:MAG: Alanine--tRNA ligase [Candidatus Gallionella acididurans]|uniref:Alanine--tRNA ligase n=1 Tax=Candidatus Gallionella acididurans TaxID=1796491 RepID=A0A139BTY9_9PROT|nr:MAG: Alanine--tRNA ligase [Candidatus Gallionella acididurans]